MTPEDLRQFLDLLEQAGELRRVSVPVDPVLEIAAIVDRVVGCPGGGPALLFEAVQGGVFPLVTNLFGTAGRMARALGGESLEALAARLTQTLATTVGATPALRLQLASEAFRCQPRSGEPAPCREMEAPPDLGLLPALQAWPGDGGRYLTLPLVFTRDPETGRRNCGIYRMQLFDGTTAALHWQPGSGGAAHHAAWQARGEPMPVAIALGGSPALTWAASAPLPPEVDEVAMAALVAGAPLAMTGCAGALEVPAGAEFVLEGWVAPGENRLEGPFGNHTGYYAPPRPCPVFHLRSLHHRRQPLYPCTVVGPPPRENFWLGKASERLLLPLLRLEVPEVAELHFLPEGIFHGAALLAVEGSADGRDLLARLWQSSLLRRSRLLVLFDAGDDLQDGSRALWRLLNQADPQRDLLPAPGRLGIDARRRRLPGGRVAVAADTRELVRRRWADYGID